VLQAWSEPKQQWEYLYFFTEVEFTLNDYRYMPIAMLVLLLRQHFAELRACPQSSLIP
jgi:hypothetical protein